MHLYFKYISLVYFRKWRNVDAAAAKLLQSCLTLCDPIDGSPSGSPVPGIIQARILEWVAISFSNAWKWKVKVKSLSRVWLFVTPWTAAYQAPLSMGFSRQEYWSGVPLPSPVLITGGCLSPLWSLSTRCQKQRPPLPTTWRSKMSPRWLRGKESACNAGDLDSIPGLGRSPGEGNDYPP